MQIEKIYFDMDGVLADFNGGIRRLCGMEPLDQMKSTPRQDDELWEAVKAADHFYNRLDPMPGALEMFNALRERFGDRCEILSAVPKPRRGITDAEADKREWVSRLISDDVKVNIVQREEKQAFARNRACVLIDDYKKNIREWEAAGGTGILYESALQVIEELSGYCSDPGLSEKVQ
ncbi:MAG: hypothetical protein Q4E57_05795 [Eubacteriales bacterium]|nr:hypothetical protein [Eubacteriales bacterium]